MLRLSSIRIGTKLAAMSGLGILLVVGMIVSQMLGNSSVRNSAEAAMVQDQIAQGVMATDAAARAMQIAVRDIRLAHTGEDLQTALKNLADWQQDAHKLTDPLIEKLRIPENRARAEKIKTLIDQYYAGAKEIGALRAQQIDIEAKGAADASTRIAALDQQAIRFARERTLPIAAEMEKLIEEIGQIASRRAVEENGNAAQAMASAARLGMGVGLLTVALLIGSALLGAFSIARPLGKIAGVLNELTNDRIVEVPYVDRGDEVGDIAKATDIFKQSIAEKVINLRVRAALDVVRSNVMVADANYNIIYMNDTLTAMMKEAESELKKVLPNFDNTKLIGTCMDVFHKNPAHQRGLLDRLTTSYDTKLNIGTLKFDLVATPVIDAHGKRQGVVVEWRNVTELRIQEEAAFRVRSALDGCATNMMVADENYNIIYMNKTMMEMMQRNEANLRKELPNLDTKRVIGSCIDIFHKNPAHQRGMLDRLSGNLETDLTIAGLSFHLTVSPIVDKDGKRLGTTVEWKDETAEKRVEREIDDIVKAAVAGDFSLRVPTEGKRGFMLNLASAMNGLCENVAGALDDLLKMLSALAEGDLTKRIVAEYQGAFAALKDDANTMAERIGSTIGEIKGSAREVTNASAEISASTTDLSQRTEEQAASLEQTSASMEEISATVKKNAENAQQANQSAGSTRDVADRGGQVVAKAVDAMARIEESSRKISDIIGVIDEIARQTNLLALNAAVEAARAGDAGRGFAVVASEVRSLAQRSSQAAKDIKDLITNSNSQVKDGVDLVNRAGTALNEIVESIKKVAEIVSDIAAASAEQAGGIEQVNKALTQMDEVTQQNSALVEENAATAKTLEQQAKAMDERVAFFHIDDAEAEASHVAQKHAPAPKAVEAKPAKAAEIKSPAGRSSAAPRSGGNGSGNGRAATVRRGPVGRMQAALSTAVNDPEWKEF